MAANLEVFLIYLALLIGTIVQGAVGFGFALVAAPILMLLQPELVPGPITFSALLLSLVMAIKERNAVLYKNIGWLLLGYLPGIVCGATMLHYLSRQTLSFIFGFLVLTAVAISLKKLSPNQNSRLITMPAGLLSGIMNITTAMGGPPIALLYQNESGPKFRSTLAIFFFTGNIISLLGLNQVGRMGMSELLAGLYLTPAIILGLLLAQPAARWLDRGKTKTAVLTIAGLSGIVVLIKAAIQVSH